MNVKLHKYCENTGKIVKISCVRCHFVNLTFSFLCFHKNFSLVLSQITNYLYSLTNAKKKKKEYDMPYSGTSVLSTEN